MAVRLSDSTSPYLRQHADNPVDWWPWGEEAFAEAQARGVPILLSIGYAACHWCHVMAHESFEDETVAQALLADFVAIKVDREERPDVDAVYMSATTALTGAGGWPMTCLLTPEGEPFWCGTYLPRDHFLHLLGTVRDLWREREDEVRAGAGRITRTLAEAASQTPSTSAVSDAQLEAAVAELGRAFDSAHGGFGGAPKFPPSMVLTFLARHAARTGSRQARRMLEETWRGMAHGGMYDQVAGGFARYSVDAAWVVPHFEKMLADTALLMRAATEALAVPAPASGADSDSDPDSDSDSDSDSEHRRRCARLVRECADFLIRDLLTDQGGFASSLDADTDGVEGSTYVWTPAQLVEVLGAADGARAAALLRVTEEGTFEHGTSTLQLHHEPQGDEARWWAATRERLLRARAERPQPARDDKVVTAWNAHAISALALAGQRCTEPSWVEAACRAARLLCELHRTENGLRRSSLAGVVGPAAAVADDYGALIEALVLLHAVTADGQWLQHAGELMQEAITAFDEDAQGDEGDLQSPNRRRVSFADTPAGGQALLWRPRTRSDTAEPSGQSALASALLWYGTAAGQPGLASAGVRALEEMSPVLTRDPRFAGWALAAAELHLSGPIQVVISGGEGRQELDDVARALAPPGCLILTLGSGSGGSRGDDGDGDGGDGDSSLDSGNEVPLAAGRGPVRGRAAAYVCRGTVCDLPVTDPADLAEKLRPGT